MEAEEITQEDAAAAEQIVKEVKRGFSLADRLKNRGLRKVSITLFLDENLGAEHAKIVEKIEKLNKLIAGDPGEEDPQVTVEEMLLPADKREQLQADRMRAWEAERNALDAKRAELEERLHKDALVVSMRAVPRVLAQDCRRRARESCGITEKGVPEDKQEEYTTSYNAHLLSLVTQSVKDTASGEVNESLSYEDAMAMVDLLPSGQYVRLSAALSEVMFRDAFSKSIEAQEDFS